MHWMSITIWWQVKFEGNVKPNGYTNQGRISLLGTKTPDSDKEKQQTKKETDPQPSKSTIFFYWGAWATKKSRVWAYNSD